jgi:hypothetical protein
MKYDIVEVTWEDSATRAAWHSLEEAKGDKFLVIKTLGYLVNDVPQKVTVAASIDDKEHADVGDVTTIPKSCIKRIKRLRKGKKDVK